MQHNEAQHEVVVTDIHYFVAFIILLSDCTKRYLLLFPIFCINFNQHDSKTNSQDRYHTQTKISR